MKTYLVTRRRGQGLAAEMKTVLFPVYQIVAQSEVEAKKQPAGWTGRTSAFTGFIWRRSKKSAGPLQQTGARNQ